MNNFTFIAPLSALSRRTRLFKVAEYLHSKGVKNIKHIGWERLADESKEFAFDFEIEKDIIQAGGGYGGSKVKKLYLLWMLRLFFKSFSIKGKEVVWALGFESAFPLLLASKLKGFKLYFDDADRFSMLFNFPKPVKMLIQFFEKITSRHCYKHIIPVQERYDFISSNFFILRNMPSKSEIIKARELAQSKDWIRASIVININGWLGSGRGMKTALGLCESLEGKDVGFILAGKIDCQEARKLAQKENVQYLGQVSNAEALASYLASDFVFTYYDPSSVINTLAASNKWGDAIKSGIGVIVNSEVKTAKYLADGNVSISFPYENVKDLSRYIEEFILDLSRIKILKENSIKISNEFGYFEEQLEKLI